MAARRAVVLLSGGLDSATTLAIATAEGYAAYALSFEYGQRHRIEIAAAKSVARQLAAAEHRVISIDLRVFGGSALTDEIPVPRHPERSEAKSRDPAAQREGNHAPAFGAVGDDIPITYVPARNTIFLSYALAWSEVLGARDIFIGVNAIDYSGYPDCRPEFIAQFERLANRATKAGVSGDRFHIHAPLIEMTKAQIIRKGAELGVDFSLTHSCYDPTSTGAACGQCDSCRLRMRGFAEAQIPDPTRYELR